MKRKLTKTDGTLDVTCSIPGGWYGNDCKRGGYGNVTIDPSRTALAIDWMRRHRLLPCQVEVKDESNGHGLLIRYQALA